MHGREQGSRAQVVVGGVRREVGHPRSRSHDSGLVTDDVDAVEKAGPPVGIADVEPMGPVRGGPGTVRLRQHRVNAHDLGAVGVQRGADRAADEAGGTGQENFHGTRYVSSSPSAQAEQEHSPGSGRSAIVLARRALRRSTLRANIANTSSWPTPDPASAPASMSVTRATAA